MTLLPENNVTQEDMNQWYLLKAELARVKAAEMLLRMKIWKGKFTDPDEGVNSIDLAEGYVLKGTRKIDRKVDKGSLGAVRDKFEELGIVEAKLFKFDPELVLAEYRKLDVKQTHLVDQCLIIKDGSPTLDIVLPAKNRPAS